MNFPRRMLTAALVTGVLISGCGSDTRSAFLDRGEERRVRVGAGSATHSQGQLDVAHFGLGGSSEPVDIHVRWRDDTEVTLSGIAVNQRVFVSGIERRQPK